MKNEIVNVEEYLLQNKIIEQDFYDKYEQKKTLDDWWDTIKYKFSQTPFYKWENDIFTMTKVGEGTCI